MCLYVIINQPLTKKSIQSWELEVIESPSKKKQKNLNLNEKIYLFFTEAFGLLDQGWIFFWDPRSTGEICLNLWQVDQVSPRRKYKDWKLFHENWKSGGWCQVVS